MLNALAIVLHLIAINIWLGGTFFSVVVLHRALSRLHTEQQQALMDTVLRRFFGTIWIAMLFLLTSGGWLVYSLFGGLAQAPLYVRLMVLFGLTLSLVFLVIYFVPYRYYKRASRAGDLSAARRQLVRIRLLSMLSIVLGLCVVLVVGAGPHLLGGL